MIEFKEVSKNYGSVKALENVSFTIADGEFVFITGASGSGKTTILRLLMAETMPSSGQVIVNGKDLVRLKSRDISQLRQKMGVIFQDFKLLAERTIAENISVAMAVLSIPKQEWKSRMEGVLKMVGIASKANLFPAQLSGGELQRASLARALVGNPEIVFADEATGNLDWERAEEIMAMLSKVHDNGKTVIIASHHKSLMKEMGGRIIEIKQGKIVSDKIYKKK